MIRAIGNSSISTASGRGPSDTPASPLRRSARRVMMSTIASAAAMTAMVTMGCEMVERAPGPAQSSGGASIGPTSAAGGFEAILPDGVAPLAPYSPAIRTGGFIHLAGQIGRVPGTDSLAEGGVAGELAQAAANVERILQEAGAGVEDLVSCTLYLTDIDDYGAVNEVWGGFVADPAPARTTIAVAALPAGASIEVSCIARDPAS